MSTIDQRLVRRIRFGLVLVVGSNLLFALVEIAARRVDAVGFLLTGLQLLWAAAAILALRRWHDYATAIALSSLAIFATATTASGILTGDPFTAQILVVALCLGSAAYIPWQPRDQAIAVGIGLLCIGMSGGAIRGFVASPNPTLAAGFVIAVSLVTAREFHRNRAELAADQARRAVVERELRESAERFRGAFENAPVGMAIAAPDGRLVRVNRRCCELLGYGEEELLTLDFQSVTHPDDVEPNLQLTRRALAGEIDSYQMEKRYVRKDGSVVWAFLSVSLVRDAEGRPLQMIGQFSDISARKSAAEARDRYFRLAEQARDEAVAASLTKSKFLATMSHEVRTPLVAITGFIDLLRGTRLSDEQRAYVSTIAEASQALLTLTGDALDVTRLEAGRVELEHGDFAMTELVTAVCGLFAPEADRKGIALLPRLDPLLPARLSGDAGRLRQVLTNLLANAIKFTDRGSVRLEVEVTARAEDEVTLECRVVDTGIGIGPDEHERVFRVFSQATSATARLYGGSGLGLVICRELVELMGGAISLESEPGVGTTVRFAIPFRVVQGLDAEVAPPLASAPTVRVLLVDDNHLNQQVGARLIETAGFTADIAASGRSALRMLAERDYAAVLMDCSMPEMDGYETTAAIRALERGRGGHVPVIALTADATAEARDRCLGAGMDDYLAKPVTPDRLARTVRRWIGSLSPVAGDETPLAVDVAHLLGALGGDLGLLRELASLLFAESPRLLERAADALARGDLDGLERAAHSIKGALSNFGPGEPVQAAAAVERLARAQVVSGLPEALADLKAAVAAFEARLRTTIVGDSA